MKLGKIRSKIIVIRSLSTTLYRSMMVMLYAMLKPSRAAMQRQIDLWAHKLLKIVKLTYIVENPYQVDFTSHQPCILMSNHISHYDIPLLCQAIPGNVRMIAKKQLFQVPLWGNAMKKCEFMSIDRENPRQAVKDLGYAKEKMKSGIMVWIAPEGTRSRDGQLQDFKQGGFRLALQTKATIIPIAIKGTYEVLPPKTTQFEIGQLARVHICKPIDTSTYPKGSYAQLSADVRTALQQALSN